MSDYKIEKMNISTSNLQDSIPLPQNPSPSPAKIASENIQNSALPNSNDQKIDDQKEIRNHLKPKIISKSTSSKMQPKSTTTKNRRRYRKTERSKLKRSSRDFYGLNLGKKVLQPSTRGNTPGHRFMLKDGQMIKIWPVKENQNPEDFLSYKCSKMRLARRLSELKNSTEPEVKKVPVCQQQQLNLNLTDSAPNKTQQKHSISEAKERLSFVMKSSAQNDDDPKKISDQNPTVQKYLNQMYERMLPYKVRSSISANDEILVNPEEVDLRGKPKKIDGISSFPTTSSKSNPAQNLAENDQQIEVEEDQRDIYKDILSYIIKEAEEKNDGSENLEKSKPIKRII